MDAAEHEIKCFLVGKKDSSILSYIHISHCCHTCAQEYDREVNVRTVELQQ